MAAVPFGWETRKVEVNMPIEWTERDVQLAVAWVIFSEARDALYKREARDNKVRINGREA